MQVSRPHSLIIYSRSSTEGSDTFSNMACLFERPISLSTSHRYHSPCRNRSLRGFATRGEMRLRRSRQVGRGRRPSREAAARARANTPSVSECREVPSKTGYAIEEAELEKIAVAGICMALSVSRAEIAKLNSIYAKNKNLICLLIKPKFLIFVISTTDTIKVRII